MIGQGQTLAQAWEQPSPAAWCSAPKLQGTGLFLAGFVPPLLTYFAVERGMGFTMPMLYGTIIGAAVVVATLVVSPETKGRVLPSGLERT